MPRPKADPLYHRRWMLPDASGEGWQPNSEESFNQSGFELPPWHEAHRDPRQTLLFPDNGIEADPPDCEPVFMLADHTAEPADDYIQPDASNDAGQ